MLIDSNSDENQATTSTVFRFDADHISPTSAAAAGPRSTSADDYTISDVVVTLHTHLFISFSFSRPY